MHISQKCCIFAAEIGLLRYFHNEYISKKDMELSEQELVRRESLQKMRDLGINPYPADEYVVTGYSTDIKSTFVDIEGDEAKGD